jgi:hypothetical protein
MRHVLQSLDSFVADLRDHMSSLTNAHAPFKPNWKWLVVVPLGVGCVLIWLGGPARPILLGCLLGILIRLLINARGPCGSR